jgi:hypothetical protein
MCISWCKRIVEPGRVPLHVAAAETAYASCLFHATQAGYSWSYILLLEHLLPSDDVMDISLYPPPPLPFKRAGAGHHPFAATVQRTLPGMHGVGARTEACSHPSIPPLLDSSVERRGQAFLAVRPQVGSVWVAGCGCVWSLSLSLPRIIR